MNLPVFITFSDELISRRDWAVAEGKHDFPQGLPLPQRGDWVSYEWLANGEIFEVTSRLFSYADPTALSVELRLGDVPPSL